MISAAAIRHNGTVFTGRRHGEILHANAVQENGVIISSIANGEQGFVMDNGEFITREEAAEHAIKCGQIEKLKFSKTQLFSEDIW